MMFCNIEDEEKFKHVYWNNQQVVLRKVKGNPKVLQSYLKFSDTIVCFKPPPDWFLQKEIKKKVTG